MLIRTLRLYKDVEKNSFEEELAAFQTMISQLRTTAVAGKRFSHEFLLNIGFPEELIKKLDSLSLTDAKRTIQEFCTQKQQDFIKKPAVKELVDGFKANKTDLEARKTALEKDLESQLKASPEKVLSEPLEEVKRRLKALEQEFTEELSKSEDLQSMINALLRSFVRPAALEYGLANASLSNLENRLSKGPFRDVANDLQVPLNIQEMLQKDEVRIDAAGGVFTDVLRLFARGGVRDLLFTDHLSPKASDDFNKARFIFSRSDFYQSLFHALFGSEESQKK